MTESMKYYESIRRKYPETVSKDQFYQIAHISKATALHLLQNGLVPCKDTGKKTRRYTIRTDDIIFYLIDRELHPEVYRAPDRWYQERSGHYNSRVTYRNELTKLSEEERANFRKYMEDEFCQYGDLLTVVEVAEAIGYKEIIEENIEYEIMKDRPDGDRLGEIVEIMLDAVCSTAPTIRINGEDMPQQVVKSRFLKLDSSHIEYVFHAMKECPSDIRNIRAYLLTTLYNAPATMGNFYSAKVNHDFNGW